MNEQFKIISGEYQYLQGNAHNEVISPIWENLCGDKRIVLRGKDESIWTHVDNVIQTMNGDILFLVCSDDLLIPWSSIETIQPLGR